MKKRQMTDRLQGMAEDDSVAHVYRIEPNGRPCVAWDDASGIEVGAKLYAAPRKWVGLTDGDIAQTMHGSVEGSNMLPYQFARAIEAKLKEKNT